MTRERFKTFVAEELPTFSKKIQLGNLFNFNNVRPWPVKNPSVAHRLKP